MLLAEQRIHIAWKIPLELPPDWRRNAGLPEATARGNLAFRIRERAWRTILAVGDLLAAIISTQGKCQ